MIWQRVRVALLASTVAMAASTAARAGDAHPGHDGKPAPGPAPAPAMRTITVEQCVPEYYTTTRTVWKMQEVEEEYTAYKCVTVPEKRTRCVTVYDKVPCVETRTRTVCKTVPCVETRTVLEKHWVCKPVTTYKRKCVDKGHYECREVPVRESFLERLHKLCKRDDDCCDPCNPCPQECPKTEWKKVWVPNKVWVCEPCTKMKRVCERRPVTKQVTVCKKQYRTETYKVTVCKRVPRQKVEHYTVCVEKRIPYKAKRKVCKCVPCKEQVRCCRMVKKCVQKQVPICPAPCEPCPPCPPPCCEDDGKRHGLLGLFGR